MSRKSSVNEHLNAKDKAALNEMIVSGEMSLDGMLEWLGERGYGISRSALGRYSQDVAATARRIKQSREVTEALVKEIGDSSTQGKQGRLLVEMTRTLVFDLLTSLQGEGDDDPGISTKDVMQLGKGLAELGKALRLDQDFEMKIRDQVRDEVKNQAIAAIDEVVQNSEQGLTNNTVNEIKDRVLGISKGGPT